MESRSVRVVELTNGWELQEEQPVFLPLSKTVEYHERVRDFPTAAEAQQAIMRDDAEFAEQSGLSITTTIEWDYFTRTGETVVKAITR